LTGILYINNKLKVNYDGSNINFTALFRVLQYKDALLLAVEPLREKIKLDPTITAAIMFNILGFYLNQLKDSEQISYINDVQRELKDMIENGLDKFDRGQKIK